MSIPAANPGRPLTPNLSTFARHIALELTLPLAEILLEPLADLIAKRLSAELSAEESSIKDGAVCAENGPLGQSVAGPRLVDARMVAATLGVDVKSVYRHSAPLGAVRVGRRLRFDLDRALRSWPDGADDRCHSEKSNPDDRLQRSGHRPLAKIRLTTPTAGYCRLGVGIGRNEVVRVAAASSSVFNEVNRVAEVGKSRVECPQHASEGTPADVELPALHP